MAMENKPEKKKKTKQQKAAIIIGITLLVLFIITISARFAISSSSPFYNDYLIMLMPESIDTEFDGKDMTFYVEKNKDFDKNKDMPITAFSVYYYEGNDTSTKKIYLENGSTLKGENESTNLMVLNFLADSTITDRIIRQTIKDAIIVLCVLTVFYLIYIWYLIWSRNYDKKKERNKEFNS